MGRDIEDSKIERVMAKPPEPPAGLTASKIKDVPRPIHRKGLFALFRNPEKHRRKEEAKKKRIEQREQFKREVEERQRKKLESIDELKKKKEEEKRKKLESIQELKRKKEEDKRQKIELKQKKKLEKKDLIKKETEAKQRLRELSREEENILSKKKKHIHEIKDLIRLKEKIQKDIAKNRKKIDKLKTRGPENKVLSGVQKLEADETLLSIKEKEILEKIEYNKKLLDQKEKEVLEKLEEKRRLLMEKEHNIMEQTKLLSRDRYQWDKKRNKLEKEIEKLSARKNNLENEIKTRIGPVERKEQEIQVKEKRLSEDELELNQKEDEVINKVEELKKVEEEIKNKEEEIVKEVKKLEDNKEILLNEEKKVIERLKTLKEREKKFKEDFELVKQSKKVLEQAFWKKYNSFMKLKHEWDKKEMLLKEVLAYIEGQKQGVPRWIKEIESNVTLINRKEDEIREGLYKIEEDKRLLDEKEQEIIDKIGVLNQREKSLLSKEEDLKKREELVEHARSLVDNIPKITEEMIAIKTRSSQEQEKLKRTTGEAVAKWAMVKDKERDVQERMRRLEEGKRMIKEEESKLAKEIEEFQKQEFDMYLKKRLEAPGIEIFETKRLPKEHYEVYSLIDQGKELIRNGDLYGAEKIVSKIKEYYDRLKDTDRHKRKINYNLLELITDLKLASLAQ